MESPSSRSPPFKSTFLCLHLGFPTNVVNGFEKHSKMPDMKTFSIFLCFMKSLSSTPLQPYLTVALRLALLPFGRLSQSSAAARCSVQLDGSLLYSTAQSHERKNNKNILTTVSAPSPHLIRILTRWLDAATWIIKSRPLDSYFY